MQKAIAGNGGPPDLKSAAQAMINSGMPDHINHGLTLLQKLQDLEDNKRIMGMGGPTAAPAAGGMSEPYAGYNAEIGAPAGAATNEPYPGYNAAIGAPTGNALAPAAAQPPVANALAPTNTAKAQQLALLRQQKNAFLAKGNVASANSLEKDIELLSKEPVLHVVNGALVGANGVPVYQAPTASDKAPDAELMARLGYPLTPEGYAAFNQAKVRQERLLTPEEEKQKIRLAIAGRTPAAAPAAQPPVPVIDKITGKPVYVSRERAIAEGMTPANTAEKPMSALQKQALKRDFANDTSKVQSATNTADELEKLTDELVGNPDKEIKPHPGLGGITGYLGILPSLPKGEAAKAEQKLDTFKGKIKSLGRAIASQEGKLGNMAVQEWQMVSDAVQNISPRAGNLDVQMRDVVRQARDLARNMKEKFDLTYEDTVPVAAPAAKSIPPNAIAALKAGAGTDAQFDEMFGAGAAKRAREGK